MLATKAAFQVLPASDVPLLTRVAAKACSLGSMSHSLYDVGGEYRRNM